MKKRRVILIAVVSLAAVVIALIVWPGEREPEYQGKRLSEWIKGASQVSIVVGIAQREEAVRQIGSNAVPCLVEWIAYGESPKWNKLDLAISRVNGRVGLAWERFRHRKWLRAGDAVWAIRILGPEASPAIPELARLVQGTNHDTAICSLLALEAIGKDALPEIIRCVTNADPDVAGGAEAILRGRESDPDPDQAVPVLISRLSSPNETVRYCSVASLGRYLGQADRVEPELIRMLNDPSSEVRKAATNALRELRRQQSPRAAREQNK